MSEKFPSDRFPAATAKQAGDLRGPWQVQSNEDGAIAATVYDEQLARLVASLPGVEGGPEPECAADCECRR